VLYLQAARVFARTYVLRVTNSDLKKSPSKDVIVINVTTAARLNSLFVAIRPLEPTPPK